VQYFIDGYTQGVTPNPCLVCNRQIRFGLLLQHALALGASHLATGHYAQIHRVPDGTHQLHRAVDRQKDQSYVLSVLNQDQLTHALFPVGKYTKPEIRELAAQFSLPVADRMDSQDLCFLSNSDYRGFLKRHAPSTEQPGPIKNMQDEIIGEHRGLAFYTIGQRKGLGISAAQPLYVIRKDLKGNSLIVGYQDALGRSKLTAMEVNWISGDPPTKRFRADVQIRYRAPQVTAEIIPLGKNRIKIDFDKPLRDITPGQIAVIYAADTCLGGGIIEPNGME
jgi:tRNA-specific 2-thiouridylase